MQELSRTNLILKLAIKLRRINMKEKKKSGLARILDYAGSHKNLTVVGCILSGIAAILAIAPYICIWFVAREILSSLSSSGNSIDVSYYGWLAVKLAAGSIAVYFGALMCTHLAAFRTARNMRSIALKHVVELPLGFFSVNESGRLRKIIDENSAMTETLLAHQVPDFIGAIVTPVSAIVLLFIFDWKMGIVCLIPLAASLILLKNMMGGENAGFFARYQQKLEEMSGEAVEYVRGIPVVKVFQQTVYSFKNFHRIILEYRDLANGYAMSCRTRMTLFTVILNSTFVLLIPMGMVLILKSGDGWSVLLNLLFYVLFAPACATMMNRIMYVSEAAMEADEAMKKMDSILDVKPMTEVAVSKPAKSNEVEFDNVTFTYPGASQPAVKDISFSVKPGKCAAFVGTSGGGKTTAASLIPRFWDVQTGSVKIGGVNVRDMTQKDLMSKLTFVFQDTKLFKDSILENVRCSRPDATISDVKIALHLAQCDDIIESLPDGINTVIGKAGIYLSGGQMQRIALARAILKDAPIVILDEATAFADPENEHQIQKAFEVLTRDKTVIMIAHRLSTIQNADEILVFSNGSITERGTHKELLDKQGTYSELWNDYQTSIQWKVTKEALA